MPQIKDYNAQIGQSGPAATGKEASAVDFGAYEAQGLSQLGEGVDQLHTQVQRHLDTMATSSLYAKMADVFVAQKQAADKYKQSADPSDENYVNNFLKTYDDTVGKIGQGISNDAAQRLFERMNHEMKQGFARELIGYQSHANGQMAVTNLDRGSDAAATVLLQDPTNPAARTMTDAAMDEFAKHPNVTPDMVDFKRDQIEHKLNRSEAQGWINTKASKFLKDLKDGKWNGKLDSDEQIAFQSRADQKIKAAEADVKAKKKDAEEAKQKEDETILSDIQTRAYQSKSDWQAPMSADFKPVTETEIVTHPTLSYEAKKEGLRALKASEIARETIYTDPHVYNSLMKKALLPPDDPNHLNWSEVDQASADRKLRSQDINSIRKVVEYWKNPEGQRLNTAVKSARSALYPQFGLDSMGISKDPSAGTNLKNMMDWLAKEALAVKQSGGNPVDVYTAGTKEYRLTPQIISGFKRTIQDIQQERFSSAPQIQKAAENANSDTGIMGRIRDFKNSVATNAKNLSTLSAKDVGDSVKSTVSDAMTSLAGGEKAVQEIKKGNAFSTAPIPDPNVRQANETPAEYVKRKLGKK